MEEILKTDEYEQYYLLKAIEKYEHTIIISSPRIAST